MTPITMKEVAAFLLGEASLDGYWFGERHPISPFWWREHLRAAQPATAPAQPAWHDAPTVPGDWVIVGKGFKSELQTGISQQEIDRVSSWPGRWYGPIPPDVGNKT